MTRNRNMVLGATAALMTVGCNSYFVMDGEAVQTLGKSDRVAVVTGGETGGMGVVGGGRGPDYLQRSIEAGLMAQGVRVQAISIEDVKNDVYDRESYDMVTDVVKMQRKLDISSDSYQGIGELQSVNDYTLRRQLQRDALGFLDDLNQDWDLDYLLVVRPKGAYTYDVYMIDTATRERVFSLYVTADKKGWLANFPTAKTRPTIDEYDNLADADLARLDLSRFVVHTLVKGDK